MSPPDKTSPSKFYKWKAVFSAKVIKSHKDLWPLLVVGVGACTLMTGALTWASMRKEFQFMKSRPRVDESMDLLHPYSLKVVTITPQVALMPRPTLHETYRRMAEEEKKRRREEEEQNRLAEQCKCEWRRPRHHF